MCVLAGHIIKDVYELGDTTVFSLNPVTAWLAPGAHDIYYVVWILQSGSCCFDSEGVLNYMINNVHVTCLIYQYMSQICWLKRFFSLLRSTSQAEEALRCTHRGTSLSTATTRSGGSNRSWQTIVSILSSRANGSRWSLHTQMGEKLDVKHQRHSARNVFQWFLNWMSKCSHWRSPFVQKVQQVQ